MLQEQLEEQKREEEKREEEKRVEENPEERKIARWCIGRMPDWEFIQGLNLTPQEFYWDRGTLQPYALHPT